MVFDLNGVHRLVVRYCHCHANVVPHDIQLLRGDWLPATVFRPSTSFTFALLDFFYNLQDQNKCNSYDFYHAVMHCVNNAGLDPEIVSHILSYFRMTLMLLQFRYNEICISFRIWSHLMLLKRGGAGHECGGVNSMADGSLAVLCPACPHPNKNTVLLPHRPMYA